MHLYGKALAEVLKSGQNPRNGTAVIDAIKGSKYFSAMGYMVQIDENGDASGNYTLLAKDIVIGVNETVFGLLPIGTFSSMDGDRRIPVSGTSVVRLLCDLLSEREFQFLNFFPPLFLRFYLCELFI